MARARWYPTVDHAARRPHPRRLGRQHHAQRAGPADVPLKNGSETLPEIYNVDTNTWTPLHAGPAPHAAVPVHVRAARRARRSTPARTRQTRTLDTTTGQWTTVGYRARSTATARSCTGPARSSSPAPGPTPTTRASPVDQPRRRRSTSTAANPHVAARSAPMHYGRSYHTLTVLPDGTVLASGGVRETDGIDHSQGRVRRRRSGTRTPTPGPSGRVARQRAREYHSSVAAAAGRPRAAGRRRRLRHRGQREQRRDLLAALPVQGRRGRRSRAPRRSVQLGQNFTVNDPGRVARSRRWRSCAWARSRTTSTWTSGSCTCRRRQAAPTRSASTRRPTATSRPPGWYYMFAVDGNGVPSVGWIVQIDRSRRRHPGADRRPARSTPRWPTTTSRSTGPPRPTTSGSPSTACTAPRPRASRRRRPTGSPPSAPARATPTRTWPPGTYYYRVVAADAAGNAGPSSQRGERHGRRRHDAADRVGHGAGRRRHRRRRHGRRDRQRGRQPRRDQRPVQARRQRPRVPPTRRRPTA